LARVLAGHPYVANLFERIAEVRSSFLADELEGPEAADDDAHFFVSAPDSPGARPGRRSDKVTGLADEAGAGSDKTLMEETLQKGVEEEEEDTLTIGDIEGYAEANRVAEAALDQPLDKKLNMVEAATVPAAPGRHRSIPSLDRGMSEASSLNRSLSVADSATSEFVPPEMTDEQKREIAHVLKQIRELELSKCFVCSFTFLKPARVEGILVHCMRFHVQ
jgi:hypothetical protein